jgi:hypothetical protein
MSYQKIAKAENLSLVCPSKLGSKSLRSQSFIDHNRHWLG